MSRCKEKSIQVTERVGGEEREGERIRESVGGGEKEKPQLLKRSRTELR